MKEFQKICFQQQYHNSYNVKQFLYVTLPYITLQLLMDKIECLLLLKESEHFSSIQQMQ